MNTPPPSRPAPLHVPVLTEVVELDEVVPQAAPEASPMRQQPTLMPFVPVASLASSGMPPLPQSTPVTSPMSTPLQVAEGLPSVLPATQALPFAPTAPTISSPAAPAPVMTSPVAAAPLGAPMAATVTAPRPAPTGLSFDEAQMTQRVLTEVQRQIDGMLEYRLREALAPILARTSEALVRELRQELSKTMRDVVSRAVAQEVVRQRTR